MSPQLQKVVPVWWGHLGRLPSELSPLWRFPAIWYSGCLTTWVTGRKCHTTLEVPQKPTIFSSPNLCLFALIKIIWEFFPELRDSIILKKIWFINLLTFYNGSKLSHYTQRWRKIWLLKQKFTEQNSQDASFCPGSLLCSVTWGHYVIVPHL